MCASLINTCAADTYVCVGPNNNKVISTEPCAGVTKIVPTYRAPRETQDERAARAWAELDRQREYYIDGPSRRRMIEEQYRRDNQRAASASRRAAMESEWQMNMQSSSPLYDRPNRETEIRLHSEEEGRQERPQQLIDSRTGTVMNRGAGGYVDPRSGTFHQDAAGGVVNTRTGKFSPTH